MSYAILRVHKIKTFAGIGRHVDRVDADGNMYSPQNAIKEKIHSNIHWDRNGKSHTQAEWRIQVKDKSLGERVKERIAEGYKLSKAIRKDAVKSLEYLLTSDHKKMKEIESSPERFRDWLKENRDFVESIHGKENIVAFSLHRDEETPHLHVVVVPLTGNGRLTMEPYVGSPQLLARLQNKYAAAMAKFGMQRGVSGSKTRHERPDKDKSIEHTIER